MEGEAGLQDTGPKVGEPGVAGQDKAGSGDALSGRCEAPNKPGPDLETGEMPESGMPGAGAPAPEALDMAKLAQDWITVWQSELSAMAGDPEIRESWQAMMGLWAGTMASLLRGLPRGTGGSGSSPSSGAARHDRARGGSGPVDAPRAAAAAAAPDARDAEIERLARHVTALERRLAELERGGNSAVNPTSRTGRKHRR